MPCIACEAETYPQPSPTEAHHLVDKGYRIHSGGHMATLPLCGWHHRGEPVYPLAAREMKVLHGPSLQLHKGEFKASYGTERELLAEVDARLAKRSAA
jgi:hypothetical protein